SELWVQTAFGWSAHNSALRNQGQQLMGTDVENGAAPNEHHCHCGHQKNNHENYNPNYFKTPNSAKPDDEFDVRGYGYGSIAQGLQDVAYLYQETSSLDVNEAHLKRKQILRMLDPKRALPSQALIGTAVNEAVRLSVANNSCYVSFDRRMNPVM